MNTNSTHSKPMVNTEMGNTEMVNTDLSKRNTLKAFSVLGATAAVATVSPALVAAGGCGSSHEEHALREKLRVTLISKPAETHDYIKIENLTASPVSIDGFDRGELQFDGAIIDCNGACASVPVRIDASSDVLLRFDYGVMRNSLGVYKANNTSKVLNVQSRITRFSEGTRMVSLSADLRGSRAILFTS